MPKRFAQLDLLLVCQADLHSILSLRSDRSEALASHHFQVRARIAATLEKLPCAAKKCRPDRAGLKIQSISRSFADMFEEHLQQRSECKQCGDIDIANRCIAEAFTVAEAALGKTSVPKNRPWISQATLDLIDLRQVACSSGDLEEEVRLHKMVRSSAITDRRTYLRGLAGSRS